MVLEVHSSVIQAKNAMTQYITIPSSMVADSQYPFRGVGKVKIMVEPKTGIMTIIKND